MFDPLLKRTFYCAVCLILFLGMGGCKSQIDLYTGLSEQDANELIAVLMEGGIPTQKVSNKQGFSVKLAEGDLSKAVTILKNQGLPRHTYSRMGDVFKKDGMVSTPIEERGRYLYALSQELENTLSQIDGVVVARVHPVLPERIVPGEPVLPSSCSVLIKHRPNWRPQDYEERIRKLLISSIPGLAKAPAAAISVVFVPTDEPLNNVAVKEKEKSPQYSGNAIVIVTLTLIVLSIAIAIFYLFSSSSGIDYKNILNQLLNTVKSWKKQRPVN